MLKFSVLFHISTESSRNHERHLDTLRQFTRDLKKDLHDQVRKPCEFCKEFGDELVRVLAHILYL